MNMRCVHSPVGVLQTQDSVQGGAPPDPRHPYLRQGAHLGRDSAGGLDPMGSPEL